ncbi:unnamed protein product [Linum trigynum]|uniref:X8 domain-containing protein n=1 Tax=Linum trigynum TaxID=586398 RepID=A0AAV2EZA4_9ROSI
MRRRSSSSHQRPIAFLPLLLVYFALASSSFPVCNGSRSPGLAEGKEKKLRATGRFNIASLILQRETLGDGASNTQPYVSSPFSLPPYGSLSPQNAPPYCNEPPQGGLAQPPPPPSSGTDTGVPTPSAPTFLLPPPSDSGTGIPTPAAPAFLLPPPAPPGPSYYFPPGPLVPILPGPSTPGIIIPGPPVNIPSPPTYTIPGPYPPEAQMPPAPPAFDVPSPPVAFMPPVVFPPPTGPPSPRTGPPAALWCMAKPSVPDPIMQEAMNYACGSGADCDSIQPGGPCFQPDTVFAHASYAFNSYWQRTKSAGGSCSFGGTAILVTVDPSYKGCQFVYN